MKHKKIYTADGRYVPLRMCIACRQTKPKNLLIRFTAQNDGVVADKAFDKQGRGAYICNNPQCIQKAEKIRALERSLKADVSADFYKGCISFDQQ